MFISSLILIFKKRTFVDFGQKTSMRLKVEHKPTVIPNLVQKGKTSYYFDYIKNHKEKIGIRPKEDLVNVNLLNKKSPITSSIPFMGITSTQIDFKPYEIKGNQRRKVKK